MKQEEKFKKLQEKLSEVKKEAEDNLDGWKRAKADFINYKKRQEELMVEFRKFACDKVVEDFIPILDNMELSLKHIPENQKDAEWVKGVVHIKRMLEDALKANGVEPIETNEGDKFNPEIHEATELIKPEDKSQKPDTAEKISKVIKKGYRLNGKVIRAAKVIVE